MTREEILSAAKQIVCGDRDKQYGPPENSFAVIADFWATYMNAIKYFRGFSAHILTPKDIAAMMALMKIGRIATGQGKMDNWIDLAGYAACGGSLEEEP